ncbi:dual 3',5'-cyclic-AMP and -GMP phosphodiesterase 11 [Caerostris extrusa]|uniref:Dual 3',5'-cyclic-AMP and -GMP phosphodiesterase 11 n=1 Tax=Caerostris extrusa TaxID=172846 RepID=A0AAV4XNH7_CAEEX|nr:dual 3',5'-cyclic-AMP and -GMP phosphodiesterase 11 [Caerostris extrusa]
MKGVGAEYRSSVAVDKSPERLSNLISCSLYTVSLIISLDFGIKNTGSHKIAKLVANKFFEKGDAESQLELEPTDMMYRDKKDKLPLKKVSFIDSICLPLYEAFALISDKLGPLLEGVKRKQSTMAKTC